MVFVDFSLDAPLRVAKILVAGVAGLSLAPKRLANGRISVPDSGGADPEKLNFGSSEFGPLKLYFGGEVDLVAGCVNDPKLNFGADVEFSTGAAEVPKLNVGFAGEPVGVVESSWIPLVPPNLIGVPGLNV